MSAQVQPISIVQGGQGQVVMTGKGHKKPPRLIDNKGRSLPTLPGATSKKLGSTAEKYKEAQSKLFSKLSSTAAGKAPPDAPKAKTLDAILASEDGADVFDDDEEIELTSLAPPPHIDVMVQKQEHRLDKLEVTAAIVDPANLLAPSRIFLLRRWPK